MRRGILSRFINVIPAAAVISMALAAQQPDKSNRVLSFSDEFDQRELDFAKWAPHAPWNYDHVLEAQAWVPEALGTGGGQAHIAARRERTAADGHERAFTSGMMTTYGSFAQMYGRFEIRCRIPAGRGLEPKFELLPVSSGEVPSIDVLDAIGSAPGTALFGNRWGDEKTERSYNGSYAVGDLSAAFHILAIEWDSDKIVWFVDGKERFRSVTGVPHQPMYLALSLTVGGPHAKYPDDTTPFPAVFDIDYVRVYQGH